MNSKTAPHKTPRTFGELRWCGHARAIRDRQPGFERGVVFGSRRGTLCGRLAAAEGVSILTIQAQRPTPNSAAAAVLVEPEAGKGTHGRGGRRK